MLVVGWMGLVAALGAGCAPLPVPKQAAPSFAGLPPRPVPKPTGCTASLTEATGAQQALDQAEPGHRLCIVGQYVQGAAVRLTRSGTPKQPIRLASDGATLSSVTIDADNVVVEGFNTAGGTGIEARGANITIRDNDVRDASDDGIRCAPCTNSMIDNNAVRGADGAGITVDGQGVTVQYNDVSGSVRRATPDAADADGDAVGIRFSGVGTRLLSNTVHDIADLPAGGYPPGTEPHPDCFQTSDRDGPVTSGVVVQDNKCVNVAAQCLFASATQHHGAGAAAGQATIQFLDNYCQSGGEQAVYLDGYPNVVVRGNIFSARYTTAVLAVRGATNLTVADNILVGQFAPYQLDGASRAGFSEANNQNK